MASKKDKKNKTFLTELRKEYFHLSNSGLSAILYKKEDERHPYTKVHLTTGTFGVMNTTLELIGCNHTDRFMNSKDFLKLAAFFVEAARVTNATEREQDTKNIEYWKQMQKDKPRDTLNTNQNQILKHWNDLQLRAEQSLQKHTTEMYEINKISNFIQPAVNDFCEKHYPVVKNEECETEMESEVTEE